MKFGTMLLVLCGLASEALAQNPYGIKLNPGERLISVNGVPVSRARRPVRAAVRVATAPVRAVGRAIGYANAKRARRGLPAFREDPQLTAVAYRKASRAASRGNTGHVGGSMGGARMEGVGHSSRGPHDFRACYLYSGGSRTVGAASVRGRGGWYFCLLLR